MVQQHPAAVLGQDPELQLLGPEWKVKPTEDVQTGASKVYVGPKGNEFVSLREAWKAAGYTDGDEFLKTGHPWIGQRVTRIFGGKALDGTVVSWLPPNGDEIALWHVEHDDGDSEDLEESEAEEALEEFFLRPNSRVEASFQGKWYPGVLRKIVRSKLEPYGVKCDSDKNNSMLLWVPRKNVKIPPEKVSNTSLVQGQSVNRALMEHKIDEGDDRSKTERGSRPQKQRRRTEVASARKQPQAGRRRPGRPRASPNSNSIPKNHATVANIEKIRPPMLQCTETSPKIMSWNEYQKMHKGRNVTTDEWRQYVRLTLGNTTPLNKSKESKLEIVSQSPKPNDGKRVRKKKVNPDFLWGDELRNPKRALVEKLERYEFESALASTKAGSTDANDDKCGICGTGGNLLCCDGPCLRAFHIKCLGLQEKDVPNTEWFCKDCAVGQEPRKIIKKGRPRPPPIQLPMNKRKTEAKGGIQSAPLPRRSGKKQRFKKQEGTPSGKNIMAGTPRSTRRNAGVPSRFKDGYIAMKTPQNATRKRASKSEPNKGNKRQKVKSLESVEEQKAKLEQRIRALETFLNKNNKPSSPSSPSSFNRPTSVPTPKSAPVTPIAPKSVPSHTMLPDIDLSGDTLEPWRRCTSCNTGRRSMTCAKTMCAVCCRSSGPCYTHTRFFPGDTLKIFKGPFQGRQGIMMKKFGRSISLKTGEEATALIWVDETYLSLEKKGEKHDELLKAISNKQSDKKKSSSRQRVKKRVHNRNGVQRALCHGAEVSTPYGTGLVQCTREASDIVQVDLKYCHAFLQSSKCKLVYKPPIRKKRKSSLTPLDFKKISTPRMKRQTSAPLRFKKAQLRKPMLLCFELLMSLKRHKYGPTFGEPVPVSVPGYHDMIKRPMDLGTIESFIFEKNDYNIENFASDVALVWSNAMRFNPPQHPIHEMAVVLKKFCEERVARIRQQIRSIERSLSLKEKQKEKQKQRLKEGKKTKKGVAGDVAGLDDEVRKLAEKMEQMRRRLNSMSSSASKPKTKSKSKSKSRPKKKGVSIQERQALKQQIIQLGPEDLNGVAEIVRDAMPGSHDSTEVEVDLEILEDRTIRELQKYVAECIHERSMEQEEESSSEEEDSSDEDY